MNELASELEKSAEYVDNGTERVSAERYYSRDWMEKEWERMWTRIWLGTGFASDLEEVGDYFVWEFIHESFIIVRTATDEIKAFYNVCPHRGNRIAYNETGSVVDGFTCSFHSWQFNLDGSLKQVLDRETFRPEALLGDLGLKEAHCDTAGGIIFINMDDNPNPLRDQLGVVADHMEQFNLQNMKVIKESESLWECNWKAGVDVFTEAYHVSSIHPEVLSSLDDYNVQWDLYENGNSRFVLQQYTLGPRTADHDILTDDLKFNLTEVGIDPDSYKGKPVDVWKVIAAKRREWAEAHGVDFSNLADSSITSNNNYTLFPHMTLNLHSDSAIILMFRPHPTDPTKVYFRLFFLILPVPSDPDHRLPAYIVQPDEVDFSGQNRPPRQYYEGLDPNFGGLIYLQDYDNICAVQRGMRSKAFDGVVLSEQEQRIRHHTKEVENYVLGRK